MRSSETGKAKNISRALKITNQTQRIEFPRPLKPHFVASKCMTKTVFHCATQMEKEQPIKNSMRTTLYFRYQFLGFQIEAVIAQLNVVNDPAIESDM
jgi:hypothetical protein